MARFVASSSQYLQAVSIPPVNIPGTAVTMSLWLKLASTGVKRKAAGKWSGSNSTQQYLIQISTGNFIQPVVGDGAGGVDFATGGTAMSADVWYNIILLKNGTGAGALLGYLNGVQDCSATSNVTMSSETITPFVVGNDFSFTDYMDGDIAELGLWSTALNPSEITLLGKGLAFPRQIRPQSLRCYVPGVGPEWIRDYSIYSNVISQRGATPGAAPLLDRFLIRERRVRKFVSSFGVPVPAASATASISIPTAKIYNQGQIDITVRFA